MNKTHFIGRVIFFKLFLVLFFPGVSFSEPYNITDNTAQDYYPSLYDGTIAWYSDIDGDMEIFYWDGSKSIK